MKQYLKLLRHVKKHGVKKEDRTGTGTISVFGYQMRFDLSEGFPLITTKKCHLRSIIYELLWFLGGDTNIRYPQDNKVTIWDEWADENGELGPVYGHQWRAWEAFEFIPEHSEGIEWIPGEYKKIEIDQIAIVIDKLKNNPDDRRIIVSAWNVADVERGEMALPPCHCFFQLYVANGKLSCLLYQRSCDSFLGVPFNIASYALLTMMLAQVCGLKLGEFIWTGGDVHIYSNHIKQVNRQIRRKPYSLPTMKLNPEVKSILDFQYEDFDLVGYEFHPHIKAPVAV